MGKRMKKEEPEDKEDCQSTTGDSGESYVENVDDAPTGAAKSSLPISMKAILALIANGAAVRGRVDENANIQYEFSFDPKGSIESSKEQEIQKVVEAAAANIIQGLTYRTGGERHKYIESTPSVSSSSSPSRRSESSSSGRRLKTTRRNTFF